MLKPIKQMLQYTWYTILFTASFITVYLLLNLFLSKITIDKEPGINGDVAIYIKTNGVHTDLVVPVKNGLYNWAGSVRFANTHLKDTTFIKWLAIGWGDKGFYLETPTWADLTFSTAFKAAFALGNTAIHATYYSSIAESKSCKKIMLNNGQYNRLVQYLNQTFKHDTTGQVMAIITRVNYNDADAFYEATGHYSMFKTCNSWANEGLKSCGQKACLWTAFDNGIFSKYE